VADGVIAEAVEANEADAPVVAAAPADDIWVELPATDEAPAKKPRRARQPKVARTDEVEVEADEEDDEASAPTAAAVDRAAFGEYWWLDAGMLADVCSATPRHRARVVEVDRQVTGSLISGRSGSIGYVQRLSVHPDAHRRGLATTLLGDALTWMRRAGVTRVFVNTHTDNDAALALYRRIGFRSLPERLRVYEGFTDR
jgi:ribosomal protein S18 acetylase RimI-like enzyme